MANTRYSLLPVQCWFQGFTSYQTLLYLDRKLLRNRQQTIPPSLATSRKIIDVTFKLIYSFKKTLTRNETRPSS
jgi:hypothetical protein